MTVIDAPPQRPTPPHRAEQGAADLRPADEPPDGLRNAGFVTTPPSNSTYAVRVNDEPHLPSGPCSPLPLKHASSRKGAGERGFGQLPKSERKRNERGVPVHLRDQGAALGVRRPYSRSRQARLAPLPRGCGASRFPQWARLRNRAEFRASRPLATLPRGLSCRLLRLGRRAPVG